MQANRLLTSDITDSACPAAHRLFRTFLPGMTGAEGGGGDLIEGWHGTRRKLSNVADEQNKIGSVLSALPMDFIDAGRTTSEAGPYLGTAPNQLGKAVVAG